MSLLSLNAVDIGVLVVVAGSSCWSPCCGCRQFMLVSLLWLQVVDVSVLVVVAGS